jgi:hypothetical protein
MPDDRIYFAGDHCSYVNTWQEGAALSARHAVQAIATRKFVTNRSLRSRLQLWGRL